MSDDRYTPDPQSGPSGQAEWMRGIERRISALEGAPLSGSQMRTIDTDGVTRMLTGNLGDGHYGFATYDAAGNELTRTDERGIISPPLALTFTGIAGSTSGADGLSTTSGTFEVLYVGEVPSFVHQGIRLRIGYITDVTTAGELEVIIHQFGGSDLATSTVLTLPVNTNNAGTLSWLHGIALPGPRCFVQIAARRTSGAGNVTIYRPYGMYFVGPDGMTGSGGAWT